MMREDWVETELGRVCDINMGQSPPSSTYNNEKNGLPFFQGKAEFTDLYPVVRKWCSKPKKIAETNDILLSVRAPVGATNVANQKCAIGRGLAAISYPQCYKYILYYLNLIERKLDEQGTGTTFKAISGDVLKKQNFPLAPLPEQRAIVAKIEQLFSDLDNGIANLKAAKAKLDIYRQAVLKKAFEGELTKEWRENHGVYSKWNKEKMEDHGEWKGGGTPSKRNSTFWENGNILWVSPKDMKSKIILDTKDKITEASIEQASTKWIEKGAILFVVRSGIIRRILPIAIAGERLTVNQDLQSFFPNDYLNSEFVYWYCIAEERTIREQCAKDGTTVDSINVPMLKKYLIPIPSIEEQHAIVAAIESRLSVCDKLAESIDQSLEKSEALRQSILKKAFTGNLLSQAELEACRQEADWEPADKLLKRIQKDKAVGAKNATTGKIRKANNP